MTLTTSTKVATIDASTASGALTVDLTAQNGVAVTVKGGSGDDVLSATVGVNAKVDVLIGGAGHDILVAGTNGATLTGGLGDDLFVLPSASATSGNKEANTYSTVTDFTAGDVLKPSFYDGAATAVVNSFAHLTATLNPATAVFSNYVTRLWSKRSQPQAALLVIPSGSASAVTYVVVDSDAETTGSFVAGQDLVIQLTGVDLATFLTTPPKAPSLWSNRKYVIEDKLQLIGQVP